MVYGRWSAVVAISYLAGLTTASVAAFSSTLPPDTTLIMLYGDGKVDTIRLPKSTRLRIHQSNVDTTDFREHSTFALKAFMRAHQELEHVQRRLDSLQRILERMLRQPSDHSDKLHAELDCERFQEELYRAQQQLNRAQKRIDRMQSEIDRVQQYIDHLQSEIDRLLTDSEQHPHKENRTEPAQPLQKDKPSQRSSPKAQPYPSPSETFKLDTHFQQSFERLRRAFERLQEHLRQWDTSVLKQFQQQLRSIYEQNSKLLHQQLDTITKLLEQSTKLLNAFKSSLEELRRQTNPRWQEDK